jgi:branched-chain amino acid transport system substrate-binding protein
MKLKKMFFGLLMLCLLSGMMVTGALAADPPIKVALVVDLTGLLEAYAKQTVNGFQMGMEYATKGSMKVLGRPVQVLVKDAQGKPDIGKQILTEVYKDEKVDLAVGGTSSAVALAMLPVANEFKKIFIVEPAVADSITGENWNRYIFRTGRNSSQDAISIALAIAKPGVVVATLAQDYAFGRDGVKAYKEAAESKGAKIVHEEYVPTNTTDFTAPFQRIIQAMKDQKGDKYLFMVWAGKSNPFKAFSEAKLEEKYGIKPTTGGNTLVFLEDYKPLVGMNGAIYYYYGIPKNPINEWLVKEHQKRFNGPPDFFTCGGFAAAQAVVAGLTKANSTDTEKLIKAMEGMHFQTPKGEMMFRVEDHQALQSMYVFKIKVDPNVKWAIPELVKELTWKDMNIPIRVKK